MYPQLLRQRLVKNTLSTNARQIFSTALEDCSVQQAFSLKLRGEMTHGICALHLKGTLAFDLTHITKILIVAIGKAALAMLDAFLPICPIPAGCTLGGVVIAPSAALQPKPGFSYFTGGHPSPNRESFTGAQTALDLLASAASKDHGQTFCFFLISGGASAMMELPLDPDISLDDTISFHQALVGSGASISEINCIRKHFSAVKGGRLALAAGKMRHLSLLLSDVPAGQLDALSSGPTLADSTTIEDCRKILQKFSLPSQFAPSVQSFFASSQLPETPKPGDFQENIFLLLSSEDLEGAARRHAEYLGFTTFIDNTCDDWDYRDAAYYLLNRIRTLQLQHGRVCLLSAGEVTVQIPTSPAGLGSSQGSEAPGMGGRNLHFTLYCASRLKSDERITILSAGSDGIDGNSVAAGAVVDASTLDGVPDEALQALQSFDSFRLLNRLGATVFTGPTGNNLRDLRILLADSTD
ncbi:glycerate kinase type-2 family protein [Granulicella tundricola]|uniref:Hydroxypyruvate reductase n=1 Tax=Granulicella tundricola (strain ATCC BAA-1859 / DSM 23138 / MP5ACTX9) TaxID=1198114 RepID=E8X6Z9_GRATM|nr:DUF4147 domain-containing protein [Granulicella tundricola]ADW71108.1 Hydroxypyruvate reductase [Granulicella tundricola MP5ACTX9]